LSVTFTPTDTTDYNSVTTTTTINVSPARLIVAADNKTMTYDGSLPALTYTITGFVNSDGASVLSGTPGLRTSASSSSPAGSYPIDVAASGLSATNYTLVAQEGTLTIGAATPTITWANPAGITYGAALGATQLDATATVPGTFVYTPAPGALLSAGAGQTLAVTFTPTDTTDYNSVTTTTTINVAQAQLIVAADDKTISYGGTVPALTYTIIGFVNSDDDSVVSGTPRLSTSASNSSPIGPYPINVDVSGLSATNYTFAGQNGTLTIGPATPAITWANPADITYGTPLSATQLDATTTVPGRFVYTPTAGTMLSAGARQTLSVRFTPTDMTDYNSVTTTTTINVAQAQLTVAADDKTMTYGGTVPVLIYTITGFVNGDAASVVAGIPILRTNATSSSYTGSYPIKVDVSGLSASNYSLATQAGTLTIVRATPAITWASPAGIIYGTALGAAQLDATTTVPGTFVYTPAPGTVLSAGASQTLSVTFTPTDTTVYNSVNVATTINVAQAQLTVAADGKTMTYGGTVPVLTYTITGFVNGDAASVVTGPPILRTNATNSSPVGSYPINVNVSGLSAANYSFAAQDGTLTIGAVTPTSNAVVMGRTAFVTSLYQDLLLRSPVPTEISDWLYQLNSSRSLGIVASAINRSPERRTVLRSRHGIGMSFNAAWQHALTAMRHAIRAARRFHGLGKH
jgi:type IV secretory pathway protease TraF